MHRKERPAGQRGSLFKGRDAAGRPPGLVPPGWGGGRRLGVSGSLSVDTAMACGAFLPMLARRSQRGHLLFTDKLYARSNRSCGAFDHWTRSGLGENGRGGQASIRSAERKPDDSAPA